MWYAMPSLTPASRQAAVIRSASAAEVAIGFSHSTCLPALAAAMHCSACRASADAMIDRVEIRVGEQGVEVVVRGLGRRGAVAFGEVPGTCLASRLSTLHSSAPAARFSAGASAVSAIPPVAIIAMRRGRAVSLGMMASLDASSGGDLHKRCHAQSARPVEPNLRRVSQTVRICRAIFVGRKIRGCE